MSLNKKTYSSGDVITSNNLNEIQDAIIVNENNISTINMNINSLNTKVSNLTYYQQTITLPVANWNRTNGQIRCIVTCQGVTANNNIIIAPSTTDLIGIQEYQDKNILCVNQSNDSLIFQADAIPKKDIIINVLILGGE